VTIRGKTYDQLKFLAQVLLPAVGTLYFALAGIWDLPAAEEVVGSIVAVDAFLGILLQQSSNRYMKSDERFDGSLDFVETPDRKKFNLNLDGDPEELQDKDEILFRVNKRE